ncbi:hypothetical protein TIFTF001_014291 [Ficus carica]|uniref:Uncharacterized protein n=1 Tax=Ficus carica TaxID=3494 RepID=A0AA88AJD1_FICCA|nr:hypothetical protein TIFTF001_014291 [Ficus carica]
MLLSSSSLPICVATVPSPLATIPTGKPARPPPTDYDFSPAPRQPSPPVNQFAPHPTTTTSPQPPATIPFGGPTHRAPSPTQLRSSYLPTFGNHPLRAPTHRACNQPSYINCEPSDLPSEPMRLMIKSRPSDPVDRPNDRPPCESALASLPRFPLLPNLSVS